MCVWERETGRKSGMLNLEDEDALEWDAELLDDHPDDVHCHVPLWEIAEVSDI